MAYFKKLKSLNPNDPSPPPFHINVDETAGTGKSYLIWAISTVLQNVYSDEFIDKDPAVRLAPTGVSAFGIRGWTINFGLAIPVKEGKEFNQLGRNALSRHQTRWKTAKLLILDEKSMVGNAQMGHMDRRLCQAFPSNSTETLGGIPTIFLGDFAQLPPVGDTPLYSSKPSHRRPALTSEGHRVFKSFQQSITLDTVYRQQGDSPEQVAFRNALLNLWTYSTTQEDYMLFSTRFWDVLSPEQHSEFDNALHLLPTRAAVLELNKHRLGAIGQPVIHCKIILKPRRLVKKMQRVLKQRYCLQKVPESCSLAISGLQKMLQIIVVSITI